MNDTLHDVTRWADRGDRIAIAMVVGAVRSAPRPLGTNMAVNDRGEISGSVSGGCIERAVVEIAERVISSLLAQHPRPIVADLAAPGAWGVARSWRQWSQWSSSMRRVTVGPRHVCAPSLPA
jgi:xanthine dehydrogenase accessory factor